MHVSNIILSNFKNYRKESFQFNPRYNAIVGLNGMGKTNLLDAIYYACMTKSNFLKQDRGVVNETEDFFRIECQIFNAEKPRKLVCKYSKGKKKVLELNGKAYDKLADHVGKYPVVFIIPGDQRLILEGSKERRQLLDNSISQVNQEYLHKLISYNSLLKQRNAYLKLNSKSGSFNSLLPRTYTEQMAELAQYIFDERTKFVESFSKLFSDKYDLISNSQEVAICQYKSQLSEGDFVEMSYEALEKDRILGRTSIGIHKDDLVFNMDGRSVKYYASQGQTKSIVLSIKLAQFDFIREVQDKTPLLLLDDIFDKLDHKRVEQLIKLIEKEDVEQVFITDTDENRVVNILEKMNVDYSKFVIKHGEKKPAHTSEEE